MDHSQIENTVSEIRKRSDTVTAFNWFEISNELGESFENAILQNRVATKQETRNRPTFDGKTISCELTLEEVTQ